MVKAETVLQGSANNIRVVVRNNTLCAEILYFEPELGARDWQQFKYGRYIRFFGVVIRS